MLILWPIRFESLASLGPLTYKSSSAVTGWPAPPGCCWQAVSNASNRHSDRRDDIIFGNESDSAFGSLLIPPPPMRRAISDITFSYFIYRPLYYHITFYISKAGQDKNSSFHFHDDFCRGFLLDLCVCVCVCGWVGGGGI